MNYETGLPTAAHEYLKHELANRQVRRPAYSLRAFARDLDLSPSTLSELLNGKVGISPTKGEILAKKLKLEAPHDDHFKDLISAQFARSHKERQEARLRIDARKRSDQILLSLDKFALIADWQHFAILELVELDEKYHKVSAITKALKLPSNIVRESVGRLVRLGELDNSGPMWKTKTAVTFVGEEIPSAALKKYHTQALRRAEEALYSQDLKEREFQTSFFSIDSADLPLIKADLTRMRKELIKKYGHSPTKNKVYSFGLQLVRVSV